MFFGVGISWKLWVAYPVTQHILLNLKGDFDVLQNESIVVHYHGQHHILQVKVAKHALPVESLNVKEAWTVWCRT